MLEASSASPQPGVDLDADGVPDIAETQFGAAAAMSDTDADGYDDLMEIVLGTKPGDSQSLPSAALLAGPAARTLGYIENDELHFVVALYEPANDFGNLVSFSMVLFASNFNGLGPATLDLTPLALTGNIAWRSYSEGGGIISTDSTLPLPFVNFFPAHPSQYSGEQDFFYEFTVAACALFATGPSSVVQVSSIGLFASANSVESTLSYLEVQQDMSGAFRPLQPATLPPAWQSDKACFVTTDVVAVDGPVMTVETTSAGCEDFSGTFCDSGSCAQQVGREYKTIDPGALGG